MDIQAEKRDLIHWLKATNDPKTIKLLQTFRQSHEEATDFEISDEEKAAIDQGLDSINQGRVVTHDEVMQSAKEKFPNLFK